MVELKKNIYLCNRWFEYQEQTGEEITYTSIPKNTSSRIKMVMNKETNEVTFFFFEDKKMIEKIEISNIREDIIEFHYKQEVPEILKIGELKYDNLGIELYTKMNKGSMSRKYEIQFTKTNKKSKFNWVKPTFSLNERINLEDMDYDSDTFNRVRDFISIFPIYLKDFRNLLSVEMPKEQNIVEVIRELTIPQELYVYDRVYCLDNINSNKVILKSTEDDIRNLEIRFDPTTLKLTRIDLKISGSMNANGIIQIFPDGDKVTVRYCNKKHEDVLVNRVKIKHARIHSEIIFSEDGKELLHSVQIQNKDADLELLAHPYLINCYIDGNGNMYDIVNSSYSLFDMISPYAPNIFHAIEKKFFKVKVLEPEKVEE